MSSRISIVLPLLLSFHLGHSQIVNLSNNSSSSANPFFFYYKGEMVVFWNDGMGQQNDIYFRFKSNNQWGNTQMIETPGHAITLSIIPDSATGIHLAWVDSDSGLNRLMYGRIIDSSLVDSVEVESTTNFTIWSASLFIDDPYMIHIAWDEADWDSSRVFYKYCDANGNWSTPQLLNTFYYHFPSCKPQLVKDKNDKLFCFWLAIDSVGINYVKQIDLNNWGPIQYVPPPPFLELGADYIVKADDSLNIHLVSNHIYLTTFSNTLFYTYWDGANWQNVVWIPLDDHGFGPLIEQYRPDLTFSNEGHPIVTWDQYGYTNYFDPFGNGIGTSVKLDTGWHANANIALHREPRYPKILADSNNYLHYVWQDTTDGDLDIYYTTTDFLTAISDLNDLLTSSFRLFQNYPNPFNPSTNIRYSIPKSEFVTIGVYNILGQKIRTLLSRKQFAGEHHVLWDGRDDDGQRVASGIYIYQLKAGEYFDVKKMIFLK